MLGSDKHFVDESSSLVVDSLRGLCRANPSVELDAAHKVIYQMDLDRSKVALICGGGSGHEPAHAGYVGKGILSAAVCGNIFSSPNANQVRRGIELVDNEKGTVIIVKNYTGDILNFGLAKENYAASRPDKIDSVRFVVVGDDVAVGRTQGSIVGRRGLAGTVLVYKIAGALAHRGANLEDVYEISRWVSSHLGTVGVGLEHCHIPGSEPAKSHLTADEVEIGMGIHNEAGHVKLSPMPPRSTLVRQLLQLITDTADTERAFLPFKNDGSDEVVLLVNNLGGLSELEMGGVIKSATDVLADKVKVHRVLVGSFMTSLNMPGFSLTLLLLPRASDTSSPKIADILSLLDEPADAPGWKWVPKQQPPTSAGEIVDSSAQVKTDVRAGSGSHPKISAPDQHIFVQAVTNACKSLIAEEQEITRMDSIAGDGDCGLTLKAGAEALLKEIDANNITGQDVIGSALQIAKTSEEAMGGTSGALYSIFFSSLAQGLVSHAGKVSTTETTAELWIPALSFALERLYTYTRARPPSRTLVDPLAAFIQTLSSTSGNIKLAVEKARQAAVDTAQLEAKAGRSAYVASDRLKEEQVPDPGAWGVKIILDSIFPGL